MKNMNYKIGDIVKYHSYWVNGTGYTFFEGEINNILDEKEHLYEVKRLDDGSLWKVTDCDEEEELKIIGNKSGHITYLELKK